MINICPLHIPLVSLYREAVIALLLLLLVLQHISFLRLKKQMMQANHLNDDASSSESFIKPGTDIREEASEPLQESEPTASETTAGEAPNAAEETDKPKILIIEDHQDIQLYLKILFKNDYTLYTADNGEEGLKKAHEVMPDLILTDIMMPVMNGFECTRLLKENLTTCHIPIIQLTALTSDNDAIKGMELGADDYIVKPFNPEVLKTKVKRLITNRRELKEFYTQLLRPVEEQTEEPVAEEKEMADELAEKDPFMAKLMRIVEENVSSKEFSVKKLAEALNVSQPTLYRRVKQSTGFTIVELIRASRLKHAARLLKSHTGNVHEVAEAVGYTDVPTFRKHFTELYGVTPSAFSLSEDEEEK